jgi:hypothetical protein
MKSIGRRIGGPSEVSGGGGVTTGGCGIGGCGERRRADSRGGLEIDLVSRNGGGWSGIAGRR